MSLHGEEIIERLHSNSNLRNLDNPVRKIIDNTIGEWLDQHDETVLYENIFLISATGKYLDLHGQTYNIYRRVDESDENYRQRIIYESLNRLTVNYLRDVFNLDVYVYVANYNPQNNQLTSDNYYINRYGFMAVVSDEIRNILEKKFVIGRELKWLIL